MTKNRKITATMKDKNISGPVKGFMDFIRAQGVVGLAVGLAIGTQAGATVKAIVEGIINPIIAFIVGSQAALQAAKWTVIDDFYGRSLVFAWGSVLSSVITLLAVAAVIYFVVHGLKLDKLDKKKD